MSKSKLQSRYEALLSYLEKEADGLRGFTADSIRSSMTRHLIEDQLDRLYGIKVRDFSIQNPNYSQIDSHGYITYCTWSDGMKISWEVESRQPSIADRFIIISFPTGPYIFGDGYFKDIFNSFFEKLKSYGPKYIDDHNHYLYFELENASGVYNDFQSIMDEYRSIARDRYRKIEIEKKEAELKKLKEQQ